MRIYSLGTKWIFERYFVIEITVSWKFDQFFDVGNKYVNK
jgi:hypothetical protein